eukprot:1146041-Pelagomonas_calceolata.AAC.13
MTPAQHPQSMTPSWQPQSTTYAPAGCSGTSERVHSQGRARSHCLVLSSMPPGTKRSGALEHDHDQGVVTLRAKPQGAPDASKYVEGKSKKKEQGRGTDQKRLD